MGRRARRAAVLGSPIGHSLSPVLYRAGFEAAGLTEWSFEAIDCDVVRLPGLLAEAGPDWAGFAVTMPGKEAAAQAAVHRSVRVETLGVANTLVRRDGAWWAENTDVDGVRGALMAAGITPTGPVLLLGGGGTARAVIAALAELRWAGPLVLAGRRPESTATAARIAAGLGLTVREIRSTEDEIAALARNLALVVSTFPAGGADHLADAVARVPALFDVIYHPWPTPLAAAGAAGRVTVTGLDMLLHQALTQFELITGHPAPADAMRAALHETAAGRHGSDLPPPAR